ncbi:MAG: outer membrane protein assembly factor BamD [Elusimicrobia bacterium]|nr:outer membrane protein assembly factor BamD [Elusimicrobiota bacterium]
MRIFALALPLTLLLGARLTFSQVQVLTGPSPEEIQAREILRTAQEDLEENRFEQVREKLWALYQFCALDADCFAQAKLLFAETHRKEAEKEKRASLYRLAEREYLDFLNLYPSHAQTPYAQFQIAMTHYAQRQPKDKDQTHNRATDIELRKYLEKYPDHPCEAEDPKDKKRGEKNCREIAQEVLPEIREILAEHEIYVAEQNASRGAYQGVAWRIEYLQKNYPEFYNEQARDLLENARRELEQNPPFRPISLPLELQERILKGLEKKRSD